MKPVLEKLTGDDMIAQAAYPAMSGPCWLEVFLINVLLACVRHERLFGI